MTGGIGRPKPQRLRPIVRAVLALGSNLGDREATIRAAIDELDRVPGIHVDARSRLVQTDAIKLSGVDSSAPRYLNGVVLVGTTLDPHALLAAVNRIEADHGRTREERWGDRTIDIDIIDYDGRILSDETLTVPHPRAAQRAFVLAPWLDVDATATVPGAGRVADLLAAAEDVVQPYPAQDTPAQDTPAQDTPAQEPPAQEPRAQDTPGREDTR